MTTLERSQFLGKITMEGKRENKDMKENQQNQIKQKRNEAVRVRGFGGRWITGGRRRNQRQKAVKNEKQNRGNDVVVERKITTNFALLKSILSIVIVLCIILWSVV